MPRVKGSKNKPKDQEVVADDQIKVDENKVKDPDTYLNANMIPKKKVLIGYHPISGAEVWQ
jgi:hypothetical protein